MQSVLTAIQLIVTIALVISILLQRSEGGALGSGSPTGLVTARGAGDLLTRTTWGLFSIFLVLSLSLTLLGGRERSSQAILDRLKGQSVNPAALAPKAPPAGASPGQGAPPPVQLPALPSGGSSAPVSRGAENPLALPALGAPPPASKPKTPPAP